MEEIKFESADAIYKYCVQNKLGQGVSRTWSKKHFAIILENLMGNEYIIFPFIGLHNYESITKNSGNFAYAITNKRIVMAQKRLIGKAFQSVALENINDITFSSNLVLGKITIDSIKETFSVCVNREQGNIINERINEAIHNVKNNNSNASVDEILKYKKLLEAGAITKEEFEAKKKQLLGL